MADSTSLSILRQTPLSSSIATKQWTEDNFLPLSAQVRQAWYGECHTAQATKAKTVEIPGITELQTGLQVRIKFTAAQRASSPTLNVNGLGAHPIIRSGTTAVVSYEWLAGEVIDLVFDGTNWIVSDGGIATTSYYGYTKLYNGAALTSTSLALAPAALNSYSENTVVGAPALLTTSTYSVGDRVRYQFNTYECISDVQTPGAWASISSHFKELDPIQIQIDNLSDAVANIDVPEVPTDLSAFTNSPGYITNKSLSALSNYIPLSGTDIPLDGQKTKFVTVDWSNYHDTAIVLEGAGSDMYPYARLHLSGGSSNNAPRIRFYDGTELYSTKQLASASHKHDASDLSSGSIDQARISAIAISKITNLQTTLDSKLSGVKMNGSNVTATNGVADLSTVLTAHQSLSDVYLLSGEVVEGLSNVVIPKLDTISGLVEEEVEKVDEISAKFDDYSLTGHTHTSSDITNFPPIPTNTNQLVNGAGFITSSQVDTKIAALDGAITGSAGAGKTLTSFSQTDGKVTAGFGDISITKSQISDFPTIPTVNNGTLTIQRNGSTVQTFTANQSTAVSANIIVPTKTSELTNDSGFVVSSDLTKVMEYQGSVTNFSDLPNNAKKGAVYDVISAYNDNPPGTNYAWSGTSWDPLGGSIDVSKFAEVSALNKLSSETVNGLSVVVNPKLSTIADKVEEEVAKLDELSGKLSAYTLTSDFKDLISTITDELSSNINPKLSTIADQVSAETQKVDEISARLNNFALTSDIPSDYLSGVQMNGSLRTVTNKVVDLGTVISSHQQVLIQDEYTDWVITPSYIMSVDEYSQDYLGKTIYLKWVEWEPGNPNASGWQPYVLAGSTINWCGGFIGNLSSTELVWEELNWVGKGSLSAKRYKKSAVLGDQTSVDLALADHTHSLSDIANVPGVMQTGSYNDLLDKPTIPLSTSQLTNNSGFLTAHQSLSAYALSSDLFSLSSQVVNGLSNTVTLKLSTIADLISGETKKLDELSGSLSEYALTSQIPTKVSELSNDSGYIKKAELQNDLSNYLPLSGGMISGNFALSTADEYNRGSFNFLSGVTGRLAFGLRSSATGAGAEAIGTDAVAKGHESFAVGRGAQIQNEYNVDCVAIGFNAAVNTGSSYADGGNAIQLGYGANTTPHTFQVFDYTLMDTATGDIPYARLSSAIGPILGNILSTLQTINGTANS